MGSRVRSCNEKLVRMIVEKSLQYYRIFMNVTFEAVRKPVIIHLDEVVWNFSKGEGSEQRE